MTGADVRVPVKRDAPHEKQQVQQGLTPQCHLGRPRLLPPVPLYLLYSSLHACVPITTGAPVSVCGSMVVRFALCAIVFWVSKQSALSLYREGRLIGKP